MMQDNRSESMKLIEYVLLYKKVNILATIVWLLLALLFVFFVLPKLFTAEVSILPSSSGAPGIGGKLGSLASLAGVNLGSNSVRSQEMYRGIIFSKRLLDSIIGREYEKKDGSKVSFLDFLELDDEDPDENWQKALKALREDVVVVNIDPDNDILYLSVTTEDPRVSADIANIIIEILNDIVLNDLEKEIGNQFGFLKERIQLTNDSLRIAEKELLKLLESNRDISLPSFQIARLQSQRKIEIQTAIYVEMRKQAELVQLDNFINLAPIKVLDKAYPPYRKSRPKRAFVLAALAILFGLLQVGINYGFYLFPQIIADIKRSN